MWRETIAGSVLWSLLLGSPALATTRSTRKAEGPSAVVAEVDTRTETTWEPSASTSVTANREPEILDKKEMLSLLKKYGGDIADRVLDGERQREQAVREKDPIRLSCIQDRLSHMKSMKKLSEDCFAAAQRPIIQADELNLRHEFRGVELAHTRIIELHRELMECVGESLEVTVSGGPPAAEREVTSATDPGATSVEIPKVDRPMPASVYQ